MANLIPEIAKMLGVEPGEEFKVRSIFGGSPNNKIYHFGTKELFYTHEKNQNKIKDEYTLTELIKGDCEIIKLPWKPKKEEKCWYIITDPDCDNKESLIAVEGWWYGSFDEQIALKAGVVFRTRAEAEAALPAVAAEMGVDYEL